MKNSRKLWLGFLSVLLICALFEVGSCFETKMSNVLGGIRDSHAGSENDLEIETLGKFAVDEHNKKQNALLEFTRVVKAKTQVVSGTMHHLTVEANEGGEKKTYEAKVWVKPWANFKELQEFTPATAEGN